MFVDYLAQQDLEIHLDSCICSNLYHFERHDSIYEATFKYADKDQPNVFFPTKPLNTAFSLFLKLNIINRAGKIVVLGKANIWDFILRSYSDTRFKGTFDWILDDNLRASYAISVKSNQSKFINLEYKLPLVLLSEEPKPIFYLQQGLCGNRLYLGELPPLTYYLL
jgi:hypothetical protein